MINISSGEDAFFDYQLFNLQIVNDKTRNCQAQTKGACSCSCTATHATEAKPYVGATTTARQTAPHPTHSSHP